MRHFRVLLSFSLLIVATLSSCSNYNINNEPKIKLSFKELPDTVQNLYIYFETGRDSVIGEHGIHYSCNGCHRDTVICLDQNIKKVYHTKKNSWWYKEHTEGYYLTFDNQTFFLSKTDFPRENAPYILYKKQLYFITSVNLISISDVKAASYGRYDLSSLLNR